MPTAAKSKSVWTPAEIKYLEWGWGTTSVPRIAKHLNRSIIAVIRKAAGRKLGGLRRGTKSLRRLADETGYNWTTLVTVAENLGMNFRRIERGDAKKPVRHRHIAIDIDQETAIVEYLRKNGHRSRQLRHDSLNSPRDLWGTGRKPASCHGCKGTVQPHYARGRCRSCYNIARSRAQGVAPQKTARHLWGTGGKPSACLSCHRTDRPHNGLGLCGTCATRIRRYKIRPPVQRSRQWGTGRRPPACLGCRSTARPHYAKGRCPTCYGISRRLRKKGEQTG